MSLPGVTIDNDRVFLVHINESVAAGDTDQFFSSALDSKSGSGNAGRWDEATSDHPESSHRTAAGIPHRNSCDAAALKKRSKHSMKRNAEENSATSVDQYFGNSMPVLEDAVSGSGGERFCQKGTGGFGGSRVKSVNAAAVLRGDTVGNGFDDPIVIKEENFENFCASEMVNKIELC